MLCSNLTRAQSNNLYEDVLRSKDQKALRRLCQEDLFFLLSVGCKRKDMNRDWLYARCREVELEPNGYLDLWAREHYKSTIITFGMSIKDILNNPDITIGIFSHTRPIAKGFLDQIKRELEDNTFLKDLFPDILYKEPKRESSRWSLDGGLLVKRKSNAKEVTIEAWGLVDGQPTSKHFSLLVYDDVVTKESVSNSDQIKKVTDSWGLSLNLGAHGGFKRHIGTRYHFNDTYREVLERGAAILRKHTATDNGAFDGAPVFLTREQLDTKRREQGPYIFSSQMLQNPTSDKAMSFNKEWLQFYDHLRNNRDWNYYVLVDPAGEKKKDNDYTVILVIGLGTDNNYYLVDAVRDRLNLTERAKKVFEFHRKWNPLNVGYEKYGMQSDIEHVKYEMEIQNYRFKITALGGAMAKTDRIKQLIPVFEQERFYLPHKLHFIDNEMKVRDFIKEFIDDEFTAFPVSVHDDMLDCMARVLDMGLNARFPERRDTTKSVTMQTETNTVETDYDVLS